MKRIGIYTLLFFGLFYFSEGKPCPEKTRPHKTRCDAYYKCQDLPSNSHAWIPSKCEQGLIYEHNLRMCVLPEDDWECILEDQTNSKVAETTKTPHVLKKSNKDTDIYIVSNDNTNEIHERKDSDSVQLIVDSSISSEEEDEEENDDSNYESSGNGELLEMQDFLQVEPKETNDNVIEPQLPEHKEIDYVTPPTSNIDPKLTAHLQRLSQLIDGLKQTYQSQDMQQSDMRPDQLNAFLAHFNIKSKFNSLSTSSESDYDSSPISSTTPVPPSTTSRINKLLTTSKNKTDLQDHLNLNMKPETKVMLSSAFQKRFSNGGYSNSQIVVNRPEGSVMFSLPPYGNEPHFAEQSHEYNSHNSPKISEDTLKTVLELSKQMIATQNVPKVIQNPAYYPQPIIQPVFLPASSYSGLHDSPFSSYYNNNNNNNNNHNNGDYDDNDSRYPSSTPIHFQSYGHGHGHNKKHRPSNSYSKPSTTIIHNNVIPVHLSTSSNSDEKDSVDSYGQSLSHYPPLNTGNEASSSSNQHYHQHSHRYDNNKFISSITTGRPSVSTTPANHYSGQYPSPYPTEITVTTMRPFDYQPSPSTVAEYYTPSPHLNENNVNNLYQPSERYPTVQYGNVPRPMYQQMERPNNQNQQQQQNYYGTSNNLNSLFPAQIDPHKVVIRPNSQKVESMEDGSDEAPSYDEQPAPNHQLMTYSYNSDNQNMQQQQQSSHYMDQSAMLNMGDININGNGNKQKHPYMPRPLSGGSSSSYGSNSISIGSKKPTFSAYGSSAANNEGLQLVNVGGNFIRYDVFQNTILPLLGHSAHASDQLGNVEVITCATGIRQPNSTDCTRYYVCSKKDGKVLSYSCPPYTAFNGQTRICDAQTYAMCAPSVAATVNSYTIADNKRMQLEAMQALQEHKRRREQAIKAQSIANMLHYDAQVNAPSSSESTGSSSQEKDMLNAYVQQAASMSAVVSSSSTTRPVKKRKYYCKEGDKIPDQTSIYSYFVCYKNAQGMMKGHKMTCSKGLLFCPKSTMCTLSSKCS